MELCSAVSRHTGGYVIGHIHGKLHKSLDCKADFEDLLKIKGNIMANFYHMWYIAKEGKRYLVLSGLLL